LQDDRWDEVTGSLKWNLKYSQLKSCKCSQTGGLNPPPPPPSPGGTHSSCLLNALFKPLNQTRTGPEGVGGGGGGVADETRRGRDSMTSERQTDRQTARELERETDRG